MKIIVTNNPLIQPYLQKHDLAPYYDLCQVEGFIEKVLLKVRDLCHTNHQLLTHPLTGSIKPNQTPYKTVVMTKSYNLNNIDSILVAEESLAKALSLLESWPRPIGITGHLGDYALIDLDFFKSFLQASGHFHS